MWRKLSHNYSTKYVDFLLHFTKRNMTKQTLLQQYIFKIVFSLTDSYVYRKIRLSCHSWHNYKGVPPIYLRIGFLEPTHVGVILEILSLRQIGLKGIISIAFNLKY